MNLPVMMKPKGDLKYPQAEKIIIFGLLEWSLLVNFKGKVKLFESKLMMDYIVLP